MSLINVVEYLSSRHDQNLARLDRFLRFRSISTDSAYAADMQKTNEFLIDWLTEIGMDKVQLLDGGGHPAVYGEWIGNPKAPTVLIYGHYDVQPPDPIELWDSDPFEPVVKGDRLYARGASDVKGSTVIAIETIAAFLSVEGACPINVKLFIEGEEESGSPSLNGIIDRFGALLHADAMISADGGRASVEEPSINMGTRGLVKVGFSVRTARKEVHSGRYGGAIRNALHELSSLIAGLHDADGAVAVPTIREMIRPMSQAECDNTSELPFDEIAFLADIGAVGAGEPGYSIRERLTLKPAIDVNGMWGGYIGKGSKTVIPEIAHAKITIRLSPGMDPEAVKAALQDHLHKACSPGVELVFSDSDKGSAAYTLRPDHPLVWAADAVLQRETGKVPVQVRLGATVSILAIFHKRLGMESLMFGMNLPDENVHAPNEFFRLSSISLGLRWWPALLQELAFFQPQDFTCSEIAS